MTPHKKRIVDLAFQGFTFNLIAKKLNLNHNCVRQHMHQVYTEHKVNTLMQLRNKIEDNKKPQIL